MKLNLGAGKKPMPAEDGWVNVDLYVDDPGYIQTDVTQLPMFEDNSVDQIRLFHVIEHIDPHKVVPVALKEWLRVLKPGGFIEIECPDVIKCCINVLQSVTSGNQNLIIQYGMQGLYGDTTLGPGMGHLWAYSPQTLADRLIGAGFTTVKEEEPISKPWQSISTIRDLRIVGYK